MRTDGARSRPHVSSLFAALSRSPYLVPVGSFALATAASVGASFVALDRWVDARIDAGKRATFDALIAADRHDLAFASSPRLPLGVVISIEPTLRNEAYFEPGHSFAPYFDTIESTRDRLVLGSVLTEHDGYAQSFTRTELRVERDADGALRGTLQQTSGGGCIRLPREVAAPAKSLSGRIVLTRDWFGAREEYAIAFHRLSPYGTFYEPKPTWYRVSP